MYDLFEKLFTSDKFVSLKIMSGWAAKQKKKAAFAEQRMLDGLDGPARRQVNDVRDAAMGKGEDSLFEKKLSKEELKKEPDWNWPPWRWLGNWCVNLPMLFWCEPP